MLDLSLPFEISIYNKLSISPFFNSSFERHFHCAIFKKSFISKSKLHHQLLHSPYFCQNIIVSIEKNGLLINTSILKILEKPYEFEF